jgi:hypothetical protein
VGGGDAFNLFVNDPFGRANGAEDMKMTCDTVSKKSGTP